MTSYHVNWYRSAIDPARLEQLNQPSNVRGFLQAGGHLALIALTAAACITAWLHEAWWWLLAALYLHGTVCSFIMNAVHEMVHGTVFRSPWLNRTLVHVFAFIGWKDPYSFWASHRKHHRYTLHDPHDREVVVPIRHRPADFVRAFTIEPMALRGPLKRIARRALGKIDSPFINEALGSNSERRATIWWSRCLLFGHLGIAGVSITLGWWIIPILTSLTPMYAQGLHMLLNSTQHSGLPDHVDDFRLNCRTIEVNPILRFLYWHMNYHIEHHMFAGVPCYHLRALHREIVHDLPPTPKGLVATWYEIIGIMWRQEQEPGYAYHPPLPEPEPIAETGPGQAQPLQTPTTAMPGRVWECKVCGFIYEEALGLPQEGIPAGTSWDDIPDDWRCPDCGLEKRAFKMVELTAA